MDEIDLLGVRAASHVLVSVQFGCVYMLATTHRLGCEWTYRVLVGQRWHRGAFKAPGLRTMFGTSSETGGPCAEETNNGHGSTFANKFFEYNKCYYTEGGGAAP